MQIVGVDVLEIALEGKPISAKMDFNQRGAIFFPIAAQHGDKKAEGISYEDNYRGNALAAVLGPGRIEVRYHRAFSDHDVARIFGRLFAEAELSFMKDWQVTYQGRPLNIDSNR